MMSNVHISLAVVGRELPSLGDLGNMGAGDSSQLAPILAAVLFVVFGMIVWAVFIRKPKRAPVRGRIITPEEAARHLRSRHGSSQEGGRRRRRRRAGRSRNPTLAETGGLPPIRPTDAPPPGL